MSYELKAAVNKRHLGRRGFIAGTIGTLISLIGGSLAASVGSYLLAKPRPITDDAWSDAGDISELSPGTPHQITFDRSRVDAWRVRNEKTSAWVILNKQGSLAAFSPLCTHLGCAYRWNNTKHRFLCPCHGSSFSEAGDVITGPASRPLDRYTVKVEGTRLWLGPVQRSKDS